MRVGVVGGTGLYDWPGSSAIEIESPWGDVHARLAAREGLEVLFMARHGKDHALAPQHVDYRSLAWAMRAAHCDAVVGVNNVGSLDPGLVAGAFVVPSDVIDQTHGRPTSLTDGPVHVPMNPAYCPTASTVLRKAAKAQDGIMAVTSGPRFETAAEARLLAAAGATVVGMTGMPEAVLMREAELHYASLCYVANGAGQEGPSAADVQTRLGNDAGKVRRVVRAAAKTLASTRFRCACAKATVGASLARA